MHHGHFFYQDLSTQGTLMEAPTKINPVQNNPKIVVNTTVSLIIKSFFKLFSNFKNSWEISFFNSFWALKSSLFNSFCTVKISLFNSFWAILNLCFCSLWFRVNLPSKLWRKKVTFYFLRMIYRRKNEIIFHFSCN